MAAAVSLLQAPPTMRAAPAGVPGLPSNVESNRAAACVGLLRRAAHSSRTLLPNPTLSLASVRGSVHVGQPWLVPELTLASLCDSGTRQVLSGLAALVSTAGFLGFAPQRCAWESSVKQTSVYGLHFPC